MRRRAMKPDRWTVIAGIYEAAAELADSDREAFLAVSCYGDAILRREVESLLAQNVSRDGVLERVAAATAALTAATIPSTVGRYHVIRLIGEGGMGAVYEAEQDQPRRTVALKVLKSVFATPRLLRRFAHETEALARLEHPGIARIYDAGTAATTWGAQPYFAMELIHGRPLLEHAAAQRLDTGARVQLLIDIAEAVDYAHRRGIIHRDLKPGNILVEDNGQPKVLDFSVARIADADAGLPRETVPGDLVGTLAYMSPEQAKADPALIDARTDVYSLGVILYELLTGRLPYRVGRDLAEAVRAVREDDPAPIGTIDRAYRGDVEIIVAKTLEKDPSRRYGSAGELAADLRRYLAHEPIAAAPPTTIYHVRKFVRRHRTLAVASASVFGALVIGLAVSLREARVARQERDRALRAEQIARTVNDFLQNDLLSQAGATAQAGTGAAPDANLTVRTVLDRAAARIAGRFDSQPIVEASIRKTIGTAYFDVSRFSEAEAQLKRAAELMTRALGADHTDTLATLDTLGVLYNYEGKYADAKSLLSQVVEARRRTLGAEHKDTLATMTHLALAIAYGGDDARAMTLFQPLLASYRRVYGEDDLGTLDVMDDLGGTYRQLGRYTEARPLFERELEISRRVRGQDHPDTLTCVGNLATVYRALGEYARAEALSVARLDTTRRTLGDDHWETLSCRMSLAACYRAEGRFRDAEPLLKEAVATSNRLLPGHPFTYQAIYQLAELYRQEKRFSEAEATFTTVVTARRKLLGDDNPYTAQALASLGEVRLDQQKYAEAESPLRAALRARDKSGPDGWERYYTKSMLGASLAGQGRVAEATPLIDDGYNGMRSRESMIPADYRMDLEQARRWTTRPFHSGQR